ncbi:MAG: MFS transporter [Solirubrobacteraceae bacterium]
MNRGSALAVLGAAQLLIALDHNIVYVALPDITRALGFVAGAEQWVVSAYALGFGGFLLAGGRITDAVGPRRAFIAALAVHGAAAAAGGIAGSREALIAARAAQGIGSALLFPATLACLSLAFTGPDRVRALAVWGAAGACGGAFGSLLGGVLTDALGWRSVLLCGVAPAVLAGAGAVRTLPRDGGHAVGAARQAPAAAAGTAAATFAVLTLAQGLTAGWSPTAMAGSAAAAGVAFVLFRRLEARAADPLVPVAVLRRREVAAATILAFAFMAAFGGQFYLLTVQLQDVARLGALAAGAAFLPLTLAILVGTQLGGRLTAGQGPLRAALIGFGLGAAGLAACGIAVLHDSLLALGLAMVVDGLGQGIAWTGMWALVAAGPRGDAGVATGLVATSQQLGGAAGLAVWVALPAPAVGLLLAGGAALSAAAVAAHVMTRVAAGSAPTGPHRV